MENNYFTWDIFVANFGKEMAIAEDVYNKMVKSGLKDNTLCAFDFTFISNEKDKLERLQDFILSHYTYTTEEVKIVDDQLELNGQTDEFPVTNDNLMYWALDMAKRGYEFDSQFDSYGAPFDPKNLQYPDYDKSKEDFYFDKAVDCYNSGNLSGAIINWSNVLIINPQEPNSYYSRAIVKTDLYTWKAALRDYDRAIEIAPNFINALVNRGALKDDNEDYKGAIEDYNKAITLSDDDPDNKRKAYFNRGNSKFNLEDITGACTDWKKAYELGADYALEKIKQYCEQCC